MNIADNKTGSNNRVLDWWIKYERHASSAAFITGFIWDNLTLRRIDMLLENILFSSYLVISATSIILLNGIESGIFSNRLKPQATHWLPLIMQFSFGTLLSGFFVFFSRSSSLAGSWPFLLFIFSLLILNESLKKKYSLLIFQISVFYVVSFSYSVLIMPVLIGSMSESVFIASSAVSLAIVGVVLLFISKVAKESFRESRKILVSIILFLLVAFNILYFTNIIPPIPLSIKEIGVYHSVIKTSGGDYEVTYEPLAWYDIKNKITPVFHQNDYDSIFLFSAVFAPTNLNTSIYHRWYYYDKLSQKWVLSSSIGFPITGGRDGGYRGFSMKNNVFPGPWRVDVTTKRGQVVGQLRFFIENTSEPVETLTKIR